MTDKLEKKVGTRESVKLTAGSVIVKAVAVEPVKKKTGELVGDKVVLSVSHPDSQDLVGLSSALYLKNKAVKQSALWYQEDEDGNIVKNSTLAEVMKFYKCQALKEFMGKTLTTEVDEKGYLTIKAY